MRSADAPSVRDRCYQTLVHQLAPGFWCVLVADTSCMQDAAASPDMVGVLAALNRLSQACCCILQGGLLACPASPPGYKHQHGNTAHVPTKQGQDGEVGLEQGKPGRARPARSRKRRARRGSCLAQRARQPLPVGAQHAETRRPRVDEDDEMLLEDPEFGACGVELLTVDLMQQVGGGGGL